MWCFTVFDGAVHSDSTVNVVCFDIVGTLKQKVGVALPASAAPPPKGDFMRIESLEVLAPDSVGLLDPAEKRQLPFGSGSHVVCNAVLCLLFQWHLRLTRLIQWCSCVYYSSGV